MANLTKTEKTLWILLALSIVIMVFGALFLFNAMGMADFYPHYAAIDNALAKYIVVIITMATGIMLFSNVAMRFPDKKTRNITTIFITAFAFILTIPLTYVLIALIAFKANPALSAEKISAAAGFATVQSCLTPDQATESAKVLGLNAIDTVMGTHNIYLGFVDWFGKTDGLLWTVIIFMAILGVVFLLEPLIAGICVVKGKILNIFGKDDNGKFHVLCIATLPVLKK